MKCKTVVVLFVLNCMGVSSFSQGASDPLDDDFSSPATMANWKWLHSVEGWPDKVRKTEISNGNLVIEPGTSGWFADKNAPFLFKEVNGDFDVRARVKATGLTADVAQTTWSLGGLMVRVPKKSKKDNWVPRDENWLFMTTGVAEVPGKQVVETKYTLNSRSNLKLRDAKADWITLRIVRVGHAFILLTKYDNDKAWTVQDRFYIADWPPVLQVGFNAYTNSMAVPGNILWGDPFRFNSEIFDHLGKVDFRLTVDFITFKKTRQSFQVAGSPGQTWLNQVSKNTLADHAVSNEEILSLLGD
ncbi:DUF1349 domain-containing protein [Fulvivirgaceae bacterium PWU4]|uniref:DUF1349 domain-containing protein n=1 Tax=Chryseosolibacter histidini TaxID=2782349 RepID=A0AAP2DLV9_9BACT|nr:DUF1349 domain-containing protein [Chryseosolibacter histidini]MBT1696359.1 DUF1349 domain-containing protein [Chryseosolibacter histidini]